MASFVYKDAHTAKTVAQGFSAALVQAIWMRGRVMIPPLIVS
jgi:hypothetical protein